MFDDVNEDEFDDEYLDGVANEDGVGEKYEIGTAAGKRKSNAIQCRSTYTTAQS